MTTATQRLTAWNEGDTAAIPAGYEPDSLDWQRDLREVLTSLPSVRDMCARIDAILGRPGATNVSIQASHVSVAVWATGKPDTGDYQMFFEPKLADQFRNAEAWARTYVAEHTKGDQEWSSWFA